MITASQNLTPASNLTPKVVRFRSHSGNGRSLFAEDPSDTGLGNEYGYVSMTIVGSHDAEDIRLQVTDHLLVVRVVPNVGSDADQISLNWSNRP